MNFFHVSMVACRGPVPPLRRRVALKRWRSSAAVPMLEFRERTS